MQAGVDESVKVVVVRDTRLAARSRRARATPSMWSAGGGLSDLVNNVKKAGESAASIGFSLDALQQEMDPSLAEGADRVEARMQLAKRRFRAVAAPVSSHFWSSR